MLTAFRKFAKSPVAAGLIGLLIVAFGVWGINDIFRGQISNSVIQAGSRQVSPAEFKRMFENYKGQIEQQSGRRITMDEIVKARAHLRFLDEVASQESLSAFLQKVRIVPGKDLLVAQIREIPAFFDPISGKFSKKQYTQALAREGLTEGTFEQGLRDEIAQNHFATGMVAGLRAPRIYGALQAGFGLETRDVSYFEVGPNAIERVAPPTDAQLLQFMKENAAQLTRPEFRQVTVALFTANAAEGSVKIDEAELRKRFEFRKDSLSQAERRSFVQLTAKDPAAAQKIAAALQAGQDPAAVAKANGAQIVPYQNKPKSAVADRMVADAAFSLQPGQVSQPVRGELGLAVVKLLDVSPGQAVTFEQARPQLEAELRKEAATGAVYDQVQKYEQAREGGASLAEAAKVSGARVVSLPPLTKEGQLPNGQRLAAPPALLETAWGLSQGGESDVEEAGNGEYYAVKVDKVIPSALPKLDEVRPQLTNAWTMRETVRRMQEKADQLAEKVRKGEPLEAAAKSIGANVRTVDNVGRDGAEGVGRDLTGKLFTQKTGETFTARGERLAFVVGKVDAVHAPAGPMAARVAEDRRPQVTMQILDEVGGEARAAARKAMKTKTWPDRAAAALGVEPEPATPADKSKK
ncbi:peptidylprolyl isomerase [Caulobacter sp. 17J80-11]|uniref:peptidylprolyl isomerase n=1 Tax=Caulobacter sp. 17J80-11 TaxID=2763502 RepID=UPI001653B9CE|nr:peptidylprolyl isomerase [Caulobacter sp. 17J80-11]MBC6980781.1 SurA N-terminal domain-containing protein [Caulobacter sp. 17J80-11]